MPDAYSPQVNDYVKWKHVEGWVYFKDSEYITIEYKIIPKDDTNLKHCPIHQNNRVLVICYYQDWKDLEYITSRSSPHEQSQQVQNRLEKKEKQTV